MLGDDTFTVISPCVNRRNPLPVIRLGLVVRGILVLADIDSEHTFVATVIHARQQVIQPLIIEAHAVDDGLMFRQPEHSRLGVSGLRQGRDRAHLNKSEAQGAKRIEMIGVFIETCCQPHGVWEFQPHNIHWQ